MKKIVAAMMCLFSLALSTWEPTRALADDFPPMESVDEDVEIRPDEIVPRLIAVGVDRTQAANAFTALTDPSAPQSMIFIGCRTRLQYNTDSLDTFVTCCFGWTPTNWGACVSAKHTTYNSGGGGHSSYHFRSGRFRCRIEDCVDSI